MKTRIRSLAYFTLSLFLCLSGALYAGTTERVSVDGAGVEGNGDSVSFRRPAISADGRFVAFQSYASNLVAGDTNDTPDIFVHDRLTSTTERVSVDSTGNQLNSYNVLPAISADGRFVAFTSFTSSTADILVHDRDTSTTELVSVNSAGIQGNSGSDSPAISADGRFVAFRSYANNLVASDTNSITDIFVHDRLTGTTERVSVDSAGVESNGQNSEPGISGDGRFVIFHSFASNLVAGDTNNDADVFVHDSATGTTERVSVDSFGIEGNSRSNFPAISADGRFVSFFSRATDLVTGDTNGTWDVFVHDRLTGATSRVSVDSTGNQGNGSSFLSALSADGRFVAFESNANNLVAGDTNSAFDIFVHDRTTGTISRVSVDSSGVEGNRGGSSPAISADGRFVAFESVSNNLVAGDTNGVFDVFVHDRGSLTVVSVTIDIKPGSDPNSINLGSEGNVPVAIFSSATFDATTVDPTTVTLASAPVRLKGKGTPMASEEDVNSDGLIDLVVHVDTKSLELSETEDTATLEGNTLDGTAISGSDSVKVVP